MDGDRECSKIYPCFVNFSNSTNFKYLKISPILCFLCCTWRISQKRKLFKFGAKIILICRGKLKCLESSFNLNLTSQVSWSVLAGALKVDYFEFVYRFSYVKTYMSALKKLYSKPCRHLNSNQQRKCIQTEFERSLFAYFQI